ncbi:hypothetical protein SDC9_167767 [bioreactor metagenome]|uniref:Uncharacterized protein n=1 Tax=bioreactor metagenome TaxID=1076179 RepID=A0A645G0M5_9ZZZZ
MAPVNKELWAIDVSGRTTSVFSLTARIVFFFLKRARSCSARWATASASKSAPLVSATIAITILLTSSTWADKSPPLSRTLSSPFSAISVMYFAKTLDDSPASIGAVWQSLSVASESSRSKPLLITCSYNPGFSMLVLLQILLPEPRFFKTFHSIINIKSGMIIFRI